MGKKFDRVIAMANDKELGDIAKIYTNNCVLFGDSITAQNGQPDWVEYTTNIFAFIGEGYFTWANMFLNHRLNLQSNLGVGGNSTTQMLARINQVTSLSPLPDFAFVMGGINDINGGVATSVIINNLKSIFDSILAQKITLVALPIMPSSYLDTIAKKQSCAKINNYIKNYCKSNDNCIFIDCFQVYNTVDTDFPITGYTKDGVHPSESGAWRIGAKIKDALNSITTPTNILPDSNNEVSNLLGNGMLSGDSSGGATGWAFWSSSAIYTKSKEIDANGYNVQVINITNDNNSSLTFYQTKTADYSPYTSVYGIAEIEIGSDVTNLKKVQLTVQTQNVSPAKTASDGLAGLVPLVEIPIGRTVTLKTPVMPVNHAETQYKFAVDIIGTGTFKVKRCSMHFE